MNFEMCEFFERREAFESLNDSKTKKETKWNYFWLKREYIF